MLSHILKFFQLLLILAIFPITGSAISKKASEIQNKKNVFLVLENDKSLYYPENFDKLRIIGYLGQILVAKNPEVKEQYSNGITNEFIKVVINESGLEVLVNLKDIRAIDSENPKKIAYINSDIELNYNGKKLKFLLGEKFQFEQIDGVIYLFVKINTGFDTETGTYKNGELIRIPINEDEIHYLEENRIVLVDDSKIYDKKRDFVFKIDSKDKTYECGSSITSTRENNVNLSTNINALNVGLNGNTERKEQITEIRAPINKIKSSSTITLYQNKLLIEKFYIEKYKECENNKTIKLSVSTIKNKAKEQVFSIDFQSIFKDLGIKANGEYLLNNEQSTWSFYEYIKSHSKLNNKELNGESNMILLQLLMYYNFGSFTKYEMNSINIERMK